MAWDRANFHGQVSALTTAISNELAGRPLDAALKRWLNTYHDVDSPSFKALQAACHQGVSDGWLCDREGGGIRYGRAFNAEDALHRFSVDVVDMQDIAGTPLFDPVLRTELVRVDATGLDLPAAFDFARHEGSATLQALRL